MNIVDSQVHLWAADSPERPWPPGRAQEAQKPYPIGKEAVLQNRSPETSRKPAFLGTLSTHLLEHSYDFFDGVAA